MEMISVRSTPWNCQIAAVQGASSATIQVLLNDFAQRTFRQGYRVAGVVELAAGTAVGGLRRRVVRDLSTGAIMSISQNLGQGSVACNLDPSGVIAACAAVEKGIAAGVDIVVLSKFGKLEADRGGLNGAFRAAIGAGLPILTAVSPAMTGAWRLFAGSLAQFIPADASVVDSWWSGVRSEMLLAAAE
jgi:Protein of unknown function (DUF2478)